MCRSRLANWVLVGMAAFLAFAVNLGNGLVFDDQAIIDENPLVKEGRVLASWFHPYWLEDSSSSLYRPVTIMSFALNRLVFGTAPWGFHLVNNLLHVINSLLLFLLVKRVGKSEGIALAAALLFAIHPIHTEAVAGLVGRSELLVALFLLLAALLVLRLQAKDGSVSNQFSVLFLLFFLSFLAAGAKESGFIMPLAVILFGMLRPHEGEEKSAPPIPWLAVVASFLGIAAHLVLRYVIGEMHGRAFLQEAPSELTNPLSIHSPLARMFLATCILGRYLKLFFIPYPLMPVYDQTTVPMELTLWRWDFWVGLFTVLGFLWGVRLFLHHRRPTAAFYSLFAGLLFVIVSNFVFPIGTMMGERLFYMATLGLCPWLVITVTKLGETALAGTATRQAILRTGAYAVLVLFFLLTVSYNLFWKSQFTLFAYAYHKDPENRIVLHNYSRALMEQGDYEEALSLLEHLLSRHPRYRNPLHNLASCYFFLGEYEKAVQTYERFLTYYPDATDVYKELGNCWAFLGNEACAREYYLTYLKYHPEDEESINTKLEHLAEFISRSPSSR